MPTAYGFVLVSAPVGKVSDKIASTLLAKRLAACVTILPAARSLYRWKGRIESARESILIIKIRKSAFERVKSAVQKIHPYDLPEIVMLAVDRGERRYLEWIQKETV